MKLTQKELKQAREHLEQYGTETSLWRVVNYAMLIRRDRQRRALFIIGCVLIGAAAIMDVGYLMILN